MNDIKKAIEYFYKQMEMGNIQNDNQQECYELAINALEKQLNDGWIPVSERLPEENTEIIVTIREIANRIGGYRCYTRTAWLQDRMWIFKRNDYNPVVIAWQPLPPVWKGESNEI